MSNNINNTTAKQCAFTDITNYIRDIKSKGIKTIICNSFGDTEVWWVTPSRLNTKEIKHLNLKVNPN